MFLIPDDLGRFSVDGLADLRRVAAEELAALRADTTPDSITDEQLERGEALAAFLAQADTEIAARGARADRFAALDVPEPVPATAPDPEPEPVPVPDPEPVAASSAPEVEPVTTTTSGGGTAKVTVAEVAPTTPVPVVPNAVSDFGAHTILAAADLPDIPTGSELDGWDGVAAAFVNRTRSYKGLSKMQHPVAVIQRNWGDQYTILDTDGPVAATEKLNYITNEANLPGGSLVAANGWCAPSTPLYSTCVQVSTDGLISLPEVLAPRGGIIHNQGIDFATIFGGEFAPQDGFNILTEAQVIADTAKTCVEIPCPDFVDDRLKINALCLTGAILQNRAYPEFVSAFVQGAIAVQAHNVNRDVIADLVSGSTAVTLGGVPWDSDGTVASNTLSAVEHAIVDIRYRLRLPQNQTVEVVLPYWILSMYRADIARRNASPTEFGAADSMLANWFAMRGARPQYVYDWQDAFSTSGVGFGAATPLVNLPGQVQFLVYPSGTWVLARQDVIRLDSVYDSVNLPLNLVTQLFMEDGYRPMRMCPLSRVYTVSICPSGETGEQTISCDGS